MPKYIISNKTDQISYCFQTKAEVDNWINETEQINDFIKYIQEKRRNNE